MNFTIQITRSIILYFREHSKLQRSFSVFLLSLFAVCFYSCTEDPVAPPDPSGGGGGGVPTFTPVLNSSSHDIIGSTITISWMGNTYAKEFSYRNKPVDEDWPEISWSDWSTLNEVTIPYLDEDEYIFEVKSRFEETGNESAVLTVEFEIDAVEGPGLRFYPLYTEVSADSTFTMDIYSEEVTNLIGAEIEFTYDDSQMEFSSASPGSLLLSVPNNQLIDEEPVPGTIRLTFVSIASVSNQTAEVLNGSGSLVQLVFTAKPSASGTHLLEISGNSIYFQESAPETSIHFVSLTDGTIVIQ